MVTSREQHTGELTNKDDVHKLLLVKTRKVDLGGGSLCVIPGFLAAAALLRCRWFRC